MKFIGFKQQIAQPITGEGEYNSVIFDPAYTHAGLFLMLERFSSDSLRDKNMLLEAVNAGYMRQNGAEFHDYSSSMSMRLGSGDPRTTEGFNRAVREGTTLKFMMLSGSQFLVFPKFIFEPEDIDDVNACGFLMGEFLCVPDGQGSMRVEQPRLLYTAPTWHFTEELAIDRLGRMLNP